MEVLVVGAGPVGMATALALAGQGIRCRIVDRRPAPPAGTGCPNLWPRTQWALAAWGVDLPGLRRRGNPFLRKVWQPHDDPITVDIRDDGGGPFADPFTVPQDVLQAAMERRLAALGTAVEWGTEAVAVEPAGDAVAVRLRRPGGPARVRAGWLVAADGAGSTVRTVLDTGWEATDYPEVCWLQRDVTVRPPGPLDPHTEYIFHAPGIHLGLVPLPGGRHRLFLSMPAGAGAAGVAAPGRLARLLREITGMEYGVAAAGPAWLVRPRGAVAAGFRAGRCLLAGEAARVFPLPVQAMNTGLQDAANLAWKLALVLRGRCGEWLLDTYDAERREVAQALLARTGWLLSSSLAPDAVEMFRAGYAARGGRPLVRTEPEVVYPPGPLVAGAGAPGESWAGRFLPHAPVKTGQGGTTSLAEPGRPGWTLLAVADRPLPGPVARRLRAAGARPGLVVRTVGGPDTATRPDDLADPTGEAQRVLGTGLFLVRPDGYVGFAAAWDGIPELETYLTRLLGGTHV